MAIAAGRYLDRTVRGCRGAARTGRRRTRAAGAVGAARQRKRRRRSRMGRAAGGATAAIRFFERRGRSPSRLCSASQTLDGFGRFGRGGAGRDGARSSPISTMSRPAKRAPSSSRRVKHQAPGRHGDRRRDPRKPGTRRARWRAARKGSLLERGRPHRDRRGRADARRRSGAPLADEAAIIEAGSTSSSALPDDGGSARRASRQPCARCLTPGVRSAASSRGAAAPRDLGPASRWRWTKRGSSCANALPAGPTCRLLDRLLPGLDGHGALVDELTRALVDTAADRHRAGRLYRRGL